MMNSLDLPGRPARLHAWWWPCRGGVDSSVVAGLLARQGYDVVGVTLQLYDHGAAVHRAGALLRGQEHRPTRAVCGRDPWACRIMCSITSGGSATRS